MSVNASVENVWKFRADTPRRRKIVIDFVLAKLQCLLLPIFTKLTFNGLGVAHNERRLVTHHAICSMYLFIEVLFAMQIGSSHILGGWPDPFTLSALLSVFDLRGRRARLPEVRAFLSRWRRSRLQMAPVERVGLFRSLDRLGVRYRYWQSALVTCIWKPQTTVQVSLRDSGGRPSHCPTERPLFVSNRGIVLIASLVFE